MIKKFEKFEEWWMKGKSNKDSEWKEEEDEDELFSESREVLWVPVVNENEDKYRPQAYEKTIIEAIYKYWKNSGLPHLPYFKTREECQSWCDENPYEKKGNFIYRDIPNFAKINKT